MSGPGSDDGTGELLSAHLDGELDEDEARRVAVLVAEDADAAAELAELARVRSALRALPAVEPPAGFLDGLVEAGAATRRAAAPVAPVPPSLDERRRRRRRLLGAGLAAAVVVAVVALVGVLGDDDAMVPPVAEFAARHEAVAMAEGAAPVGDGFEPMSADELDAMEGPMAAPPTLGDDVARMAGYHDPAGTLHVVYDAGGMAVSVYAQAGEVDFAALPDDGEQMAMDGDPAWLAQDVPVDGRAVEVLVVQRGATAYTFVADAPHDRVVAVVQGLARATAA